MESQHSVQSHHGKRGFNGQSCFHPCSGDDDDDKEEEEEEDFYLEKGYEVSGCSVLEGEMCSKVVGHVIGVATWQRCTYGAYLEDRKGEWTALICAHLAAHACAATAAALRSLPTPPEQTHRLGFLFGFLYLLYCAGALGQKHSADHWAAAQFRSAESTLSRFQPQFLCF